MKTNTYTRATTTAFNHPIVVAKQKQIETLLHELSRARTPDTMKAKANRVRTHMNELKRLNRALERKHVATVITRTLRSKNTKL